MGDDAARALRRKVWFHRAGAIFWTLMIWPAFALWADAVWFVIAASLYANIKSDWGAAEAADDRAVLEALARVEGRLERIEAQLDTMTRG